MPKIEVLNHKENKFMFIDNDLWMWDTPRERELQQDLAKKAYGNVLVAGYGFGIIVKFLLKNPKVKSVKVVEKYPEVLDKIKENEELVGDVIIKDFYDLKEENKFDCVIGDIWQDIDSKFLEDYVKFKEKAQKLLNNKGKILAWGGDYFEYLLKSQSI